MAGQCKGKCITVHGIIHRVFQPYKRGYQFCKKCDGFYKTKAVFCPCCKYHLRYKSRFQFNKQQRDREQQNKQLIITEMTTIIN